MDTHRPHRPTYSQSWKLWCLALHLLHAPRSEVTSLLAKRSQAEADDLRHRMKVIRRDRAIPVAEFLP